MIPPYGGFIHEYVAGLMNTTHRLSSVMTLTTPYINEVSISQNHITRIEMVAIV